MIMISCQEATRLASEALEHPLGPRQWLALRVHLLFCPPCSRFARQIRLMERLFERRYQGQGAASMAAGPALSAAARARINEALAARGDGSAG